MVLAAAAVTGLSAAVDAAEDVTPPALVNLVVTPTTVDTTFEPATVRVRIEATDDLSGFGTSTGCGNGSIDVRHVDGSNPVGWGSLPFTSGDRLNAVFELTLTFPRFGRAGSYPIRLTLCDAVGNSRTYTASTLAALGFPSAITVTSAAEDVTPPSLVSFAATPTTVETYFASAAVRVRIEATDDLSGFGTSTGCGNGSIDVRHVDGSNPVGWGSLPFTSGDRLNAVFELTLTFPRYSRTGSYPIRLTLCDAVGNSRTYTASTLAALGFPSAITVTSAAEDVTPPSLVNLAVAPTTVQTYFGSAAVRVRIEATDDIAGFGTSTGCGNGSIDVRHEDGSNAVGWGSLPFTSGDRLNAVFELTLTFPRYSRTGSYPIRLTLCDAVGNSRTYTASTLAALGLPSAIAVVPPAPTAPSFNATDAPPSGTVGATYGPYSFAASGYPDPTFAVATGDLPPGLRLDATSGLLSGTPTAAGSFTFTVRASNGVDPDAVSASMSIAVAPAPMGPTLLAAGPPVSGTAGASYGPYTFEATGHPVPTFAVASGSLPTGLSINSTTGVLSGTPTTPASFTFTVRASNGVGPDAVSPSITITVVAAGLAFHPLTPARVLDSRPAGPQVGPYGTPWGAGQSRGVTVAGLGQVPVDAQAVVLNVTVTGTTAAGYLTIWPAGQSKPLASSLNWASGQTIPNAVTVKVGDGGEISVFNAVGDAHVIVDVVGYYDGRAGDGLTPLNPVRILDSRPAGPQIGPYKTPWGSGSTRDVTVAGVAGAPVNTDAVVVNVTVTGTTAPGYLTIWPGGQPQPLASSLNWRPGQTIPNAVTVKVGAGGKISVFNAAGEAHVIIDVVGSFAPGTGDLFHPLSPARIQDSRPGGPQVGPHSTPWGAGVSRDLQVTGMSGVAAHATAVLMNVTVTGTTADSYLTVWPAGQAAPLASSLNWAAGDTIPNSVTARLGATGGISVKNAAGNVHVIADVAGWYG